MKKSYEMDMCSGPILPKVLEYAFPLMLTGMLQLFFNAADVIVVGRFAGSESLAAVGSTTALINMLINVFVGLSVGTNVLTARYYGAKNKRDLSATIHTSVALSIVSGIFLALLGVFTCRFWLHLMGTPDDVIEKASLYMRIYFLGMPVVMLYNFGSAILRAVGDTKRPLYYLIVSGIFNVIANLVFVIVFHMDVAGVALATMLAQGISAYLVLRCLTRSETDIRLDLHALRIERRILIRIMRIGLPAGFQGVVFSMSNVLIQSSVNSFGSTVMAGHTAGSNIEGFIYMGLNSLYQTNLSFTSQNLGADRYDRINRVMLTCIGTVSVMGLVFGQLAVHFAEPLVGIYSGDPDVIRYGAIRLTIMCRPYFICGIMDCIVGSIRGLGYSVLPMIVSLTGACGFRVLWIFTYFAAHRSLEVLYWSYPLSWSLTALTHVICYLVIYFKKVRPRAKKQAALRADGKNE